MEEKTKQLLQTGLCEQEVREKRDRGLVNNEPDLKTKSYAQIFRDNLFTLFNLINVILLVCILLTGSIKNALFFLVVIWNFLIGSIQEIRAKKTIEKLSLLSAPKACVLRDGKIKDIPVNEVVLGDIMQLQTGNQICADSVVRKGSCQVNESLITGESVPVSKKEGDHLLSGSFLISGKVLAETEHVGADNYVNQITAGAKKYKKPDSVIMKSVRSIVRVIALAMIPLAGLLIWNNFFRTGLDFNSAMIKTVAAISSMIPGGLVLLVSIVLAVSVVRLSAHKTLVQDLYCVENLARVDMLLLDKTGTITEGSLEVESVISLQESVDPGKDLELFFRFCSDENPTALAMKDYLGLPSESCESTKDITFVPFSSEKKYSTLQRNGLPDLVFGAPEMVLPDADPDLKETIEKYTGKGKRVVLFAREKTPLALVVIRDRIRASARDTFRYFEEQGVSIKVISGDAPLTVSMIAGEAGLKNADKWADASLLTDDDSLRNRVEETTVFGRVTPQQKQKIVRLLKEQGHVVAMTGDGANDVLAFRESDCSIAMQSGADAARHAANLVLLNSDFSSLPLVVAEGRKSINNLQRSAALYLTKTTYSFLFAIFFLFASALSYPFENIQITLIGAVTIGIPSFVLALEPNSLRIRDHFMKNVFRTALPSGILEALALIALEYVLKYRLHLNPEQISSACVYMLLLMGILVILNICGKLNLWKGGLLALLCGISAGALLLFSPLFSVTFPGTYALVAIGICAACFLALEFVFTHLVFRK